MKVSRKYFINLLTIAGFGLASAIICQFFTKEPADRYIQIRNFRYGKDPSVIRCNRGDTLHLTFSTDDTGHSFFLEEFDVDAKVSPAINEVTVFNPANPSLKPEVTREVIIVAKHPGILNYLVSKSNYRCHVWCGPMHAFEQGKLIIMPNTLLCFSLGSLLGILILFIIPVVRPSTVSNRNQPIDPEVKDLLKGRQFLRNIIVSRWAQIIVTIVAMVMIYIVIMTSVFGTKVSGRNLGVLMMWAVWLFLLIVVLTPFGGRVWCTICPLPFFGDWLQRRSLFSPQKGKRKDLNNDFSGFFLKWPHALSNNWFRLIIFLILATFSTTLVATPKISGITVLMLLLVPTFMAMIWELRAFCRYVCPVSVFVGPFSGMSMLALRNKSQEVCDRCKPHYCQKGNSNGWACPYGINVGEMKENADCGLCLECTRSCTYNNVSLFKRPFGSEYTSRNLSEAWLTIAIFTISVIYSILYLGPWPVVRDYVNILDKKNWDLFGIYSLIVWSLVLIIVPGILFLSAAAGIRLSKARVRVRELFLSSTGSLLPLGLMLWISFVIPMLFVNMTFIIQSASDPFGWGWDFFGTANIPWHQFLPRYIPIFQAILVLSGLYISLRNLRNSNGRYNLTIRQAFLLNLPLYIFLIVVAVAMLFFFTN
jgi:polyferredoxin